MSFYRIWLIKQNALNPRVFIPSTSRSLHYSPKKNRGGVWPALRLANGVNPDRYLLRMARCSGARCFCGCSSGFKEQRGTLRKRKTLVILAIASRMCLHLTANRPSPIKAPWLSDSLNGTGGFAQRRGFAFNVKSGFIPAHRVPKNVRKHWPSFPSGLGHVAILGPLVI